jgi:hypothetical protein
LWRRRLAGGFALRRHNRKTAGETPAPQESFHQITLGLDRISCYFHRENSTNDGARARWKQKSQLQCLNVADAPCEPERKLQFKIAGDFSWDPIEMRIFQVETSQ